MRRKIKILKDIHAQIDNMGYALVDDELDKDFPKEVKDIIITGYRGRIEELKAIKVRLEYLLV